MTGAKPATSLNIEAAPVLFVESRDDTDTSSPTGAHGTRTISRKFPEFLRHNALFWSIFLVSLASLLSWLSASLRYASFKHQALILGDSLFASYRITPGSRFQDWLEQDLGSDWSVINFAEPASHVADFYLQFAEADFLRVSPSVVLVELGPRKLAPETDHAPRLSAEGENLKWLPLSREGGSFLKSLDAHDKRTAVVQKVGLIFGFYDAIRTLWLETVEWPYKRRRRAHADSHARELWNQKSAKSLGGTWAHRDYARNPLQLDQTTETKDFVFLVGVLQARHIPVVVVIPPDLDPDMARTLPPAALMQLRAVYEHTLKLCQKLNVPVVDFNTSDKQSWLQSEDWDDLNHLRSSGSARHMAVAVGKQLRSLAISKP